MRWWNGTTWETFTRIYVQATAPDDTGGIWIDTSTTDLPADASTALKDLISIITILQEHLNRVLWAFDSEIDLGDATNNKYTAYTGQTIIEPTYGTSVTDDAATAAENIVNGVLSTEPTADTPNGRAIRVKRGTYAQIQANLKNILDYEQVWCTDKEILYIVVNNTLKVIGSTTGGTTDTTVDGILTSTINGATKITGIEMVDLDATGNTYQLRVKDGALQLHDERLDTNSLAGNAQTLASGTSYTMPYFPITSNDTGNTTSPMIYINMVYCGDDNDSEDYNSCSHNAIELVNLTNDSLNLKGLYLHYTEKNIGSWISLPLIGTIPSKGTFLIRGAQCAFIGANTTVINVDTYDMLWTKTATYNSTVLEITGTSAHSVWDSGGYLKLSYNCSLYLSAEPSTDYYKTNTLTGDPWSSSGFAYEYVDLIGIGSYNSTNMPTENTPLTSSAANKMLMRYYCMDTVSQAVTAAASRNNSTDWTYIDLTTTNSDIAVADYRPMASSEGKNIFFDKHLLTPGVPNIVTCSFGYNAHTTRCFTWVSVGYYNEYIQISTTSGDYSAATQYESFKSGDGRASTNNRNNSYYDRIRWITTDGTSVTTHKIILDFTTPTAGTTTTYYYRVGRPGYWTSERSFTMRNRDDVISSGFNFLQVTDQQGFKGEEYQTWKLSAEYIVQDRTNKPYDFVINTGDIAQDGNRINEWLDYFNAGNTMFQDREQMFTIGNNDLCETDPSVLIDGSDLSKINPAYGKYFFTFELPYTIPTAANGTVIDSVYSFIYGNTYFLSMNSEITATTETSIYGDTTNSTYTTIQTWCTNDLTHIDSKVTHKIAFCHDTPINLVTANLMYAFSLASGTLDTTQQRGGSHLNTVGNYWFMPWLESNGFKLCFGGHKHTEFITKFVKENTTVSMQPYVYDSTYVPAEGSTAATYPSWYTALPSRNQLCCTLTNDSTLNFVKYIVCQATGYKLTSNKELPGDNIPWADDYYPDTETYNSTTNTVTNSANKNQLFPHYALYNVGTGTETDDNTNNATSRARIVAKIYKIVLTATPTVKWLYKYNVPITLSQLEKIGGHGSSNANYQTVIPL